MRGRYLFERFRWCISFIEIIFKIVPRFAQDILWTLVGSSRGKFGLLVRYVIARNSAKCCGSIVFIGPNVEIRNWDNLTIGSNVSIHRGCYIDALGGITLGDDVSIAHNTSILSFDHTWDNHEIPIRENIVAPQSVKICRDVWIGCGVRVLSGVEIGSRTVVAAGAVVSKSIESGVLVGGVPARILKRID